MFPVRGHRHLNPKPALPPVETAFAAPRLQVDLFRPSTGAQGILAFTFAPSLNRAPDGPGFAAETLLRRSSASTTRPASAPGRQWWAVRLLLWRRRCAAGPVPLAQPLGSSVPRPAGMDRAAFAATARIRSPR